MSEWRSVEIGELCELIVDCVNRTAPTVPTATPYKMIRTTNVKAGWIDTTAVKYSDEKTYRKWTRRAVPRRNDVVLTREAPLGQVGLLRTDETVFLGQRLMHYRADPEKSDHNFLLYALMGDAVQAQLKAYGSGATVEHVRVPDCLQLIIRAPSPRTQRRVGDVLGSFDDLIENNRRRIELLEQMAQAIYREWFGPGHRSDEWEVVTLGDAVELRYGKALKESDRHGGPVAVVGSSAVVGWHDVALVTGPAVVVGRKGNVGNVQWVDQDCYPIDTTYFVATDLPLYFAYQQLRSLNFVNSHAAVPGLSRDQAYRLPFFRPPLHLLDRFEVATEPLRGERFVLETLTASLVELRDLLLPKLVTGEIDVSHLDLDELLEQTAA